MKDVSSSTTGVVVVVLKDRRVSVIGRIRTRIRIGYLILGIEFAGLDNDETNLLGRDREGLRVLG
jgi:hypothetical protein